MQPRVDFVSFHWINDSVWIIFVGVFLSCFSARLLLELKNAPEAAQIYRDLLERNPENTSYYRGLQTALSPGDFPAIFPLVD